MRTEDHQLLARHLIDSGSYRPGQLKTRMFLLGNVIPDYNRFSYLGSHLQYFSNGHSFLSARHIAKHVLENPFTGSLHWWYQAGKMFHYLTDSFTLPHNPEFGLSSKQHIAYELQLQTIFSDRLGSNNWKIPTVGSDPYQWLIRRHNFYLRLAKQIDASRTEAWPDHFQKDEETVPNRFQEEDCHFICTTIPALWKWLLENKINMPHE